MDTIFIEIASYRDDELAKTIDSLLTKAAYPDRLRFGIVQQYGDETKTQLDAYANDARFKIAMVPWREARGVGRARRMSDELYQGEDFYLQIDAHMRAEPNWDDRLVSEWRSIGDERAILTSYPPAYKYTAPDEVEYVPSDPNRLVVHEIHQEFIPIFFGQALTDGSDTRGSFAAGGLQFGPGQVCREVPYEPDICFIGEEIVHSIRLFAAGYRLYSVQDQVLWHLYLRSKHQPNARHFWKDFQADTELSKVYDEMNTLSFQTTREYFAGHRGVSAEVIEAFENFSGVDLAKCLVNPRMYDLPPLPMAVDNQWRSQGIDPHMPA